jgi:hypothetical protein
MGRCRDSTGECADVVPIGSNLSHFVQTIRIARRSAARSLIALA